MRKDIVEDPNSRGLSEKQRENRVRSILNRAETINQKIGGKEAGYGSSLLEREVKDMLYPPITWTRLLRKYLNSGRRHTLYVHFRVCRVLCFY